MHASTILLAFALIPIGSSPSTPALAGAVQVVEPPREGRPQEEPPKDKRDTSLWPWGNAREAQRIEHEFCGVWQLFRADLAGFSYLGSDCHGYLIAQPGYCALQFRLLDRAEQDRRVVFPGFAAGTYRWKYDATRLLVVLETLLGADDMGNDVSELRYERAGFTREYRIDLAGDEMTLERGNESRLLFRRVPDAPRLPEPEPIDARPPQGGERAKEPRGGR